MTRARGDRGFTLIETVAAILVFSLVTLGITPMLVTSLKASSKSRSYTIGKNLALQQMERIRGLPFFESVKGQVTPTRRDLLDLYYPDMGSGYSSGKFTTTCTPTSSSPAASGPQACPAEFENAASSLPPGHSMTIEAEFVKPGAISGGEQSFDRVTPTNYDWSSTSTERPPERLVRLKVTTAWIFAGVSRQFALTGLIGEKSLSPEKVRGQASVDFGIQAITSYLADDGRVSTLTSTAGTSSATVETRSVSAADYSARAGRLTLADAEFDGLPGSVVADLYGATTILHAPPDSFYGPNVTEDSRTVSYQSSPTASPVNMAFLGPTGITTPGVKVVDELPRAEGTFALTGSDLAYWVDNQASTGSRTDLLLHGTRNMLAVRRDVLGISGTTKSEATALSPVSSRKVESSANLKIGRIDLFPTTFINQENRAVMVLRDLQVDLMCRSTASDTTATVTGTWSAKFKYWRDLTNDNKDNGSYSPEVTIGGSIAGGTEVLESIQAENPLVYDDAQDAKDVRLFVTGTQKGYFQDWSMNPQITWSKDVAGRTTAASVEGVFQVITAPTNPAIEASALNITIGKLSCRAVDKRGA